MTTTTPLKPRTKAVLDYVSQYIGEHGFSPTVRDIMAGCGMLSPSTAHRHLCLLEGGGYIVIDPRAHRTIRVVPQGQDTHRHVGAAAGGGES